MMRMICRYVHDCTRKAVCFHSREHIFTEECPVYCIGQCIPLFEYEVLAAVAKEAEKEEEDDVKDSDLSL